MNYTKHNYDSLDIPKGFNGKEDLLPINPYEQGMYDFWYKENNWCRAFDEDATKLYHAGRRNAEIMILTLRSRF